MSKLKPWAPSGLEDTVDDGAVDEFFVSVGRKSVLVLEVLLEISSSSSLLDRTTLAGVTVPSHESAFLNAESASSSAMDFVCQPFCLTSGHRSTNSWTVSSLSSCSRMFKPGDLAP